MLHENGWFGGRQFVSCSWDSVDSQDVAILSDDCVLSILVSVFSTDLLECLGRIGWLCFQSLYSFFGKCDCGKDCSSQRNFELFHIEYN